MVIYADIVFLTNLLIDTVTLSVTAWTQKIKIRPVRLFAASSLGAAYVIMMFFPVLSSMYTLGIKFLFSAAMVMIAFGFHSLQFVFRNLVSFYIVNFVAGGGIFAIYYMYQSQHEVVNGILVSLFGTKQLHFKTTLILVIILLIILMAAYRYLVRTTGKRQAIQQFIVEMEVRLEEHTLTCQGLIDTGNRLYDPLTSSPVVIVEFSLLKDILPPTMKEGVQGDMKDLLPYLEDESVPFRDRLRFVPYRGVQKGTQFMLALKPDQVLIHHGEQKFQKEKVLLGIRGDALSSEGKFQAIIHPDLLEGDVSQSA
ncbi:sigma-E processing peptidase SpoIIGA [Marinicrinis lubricantis]|uniref:Sigma-E processing peptidase SpoIIGA n=2 Tax=Marinicrinis lubricantis TaxID=2086470 RepID=A0ABW1IT01_9BACL